nr:MAG TPA: hypothetical protein [Caudoviricetes sp.]
MTKQLVWRCEGSVEISDYTFSIWKKEHSWHLKIDSNDTNVVLDNICLYRLEHMMNNLLHLMSFNTTVIEVMGYINRDLFNHIYRVCSPRTDRKSVYLQFQNSAFRFQYRDVPTIKSIRSFIGAIRREVRIENESIKSLGDL